MKNVLSLVALSFCTFLSAQEYTPMLAEVNEWHFTTCFSGDCNEDVYYTDGEMVVEGNIYKVLDGYHYISREFLLREELEEKRVYLATIINDIFREYLLYDFSLNIGDTFEMTNPVSPFPQDGGMLTLEDIQMLELADGNLYRHFYFSPSAGNTTSTWDAVWVEGVGSLSLPNAPGGNPSTNSAGRVSCAFRNSAAFYTDFEIVEDCSPTVLTIDDAFYNNTITIVTKQDKLTISSSQQITGFQLFDTAGKVVLSEDVSQLNETSFETSQLSKGVYFLRIKGDQLFCMKKVLIK